MELAIYRVVNGNRIRLEREDDLELDPDAWHSLKIFQERGEIRVYLGGIRVFASVNACRARSPALDSGRAATRASCSNDFRIEDETEDAPAAPAIKNNESTHRRG